MNRHHNGRIYGVEACVLDVSAFNADTPRCLHLIWLGVLLLVMIGPACSDSPGARGPEGTLTDAADDQIVRPQPDSGVDTPQDGDDTPSEDGGDVATDADDLATTDGEEVGPQPPVAIAGDDLTTRAGTPVELNGSDSYDPDGTIVQFEWTFGDGTSDDGEVVYHTYPDPGAYVVRLTVTDNDGLTGSDTVMANIDTFNEGPRAVIRSPEQVVATEEAEFDATDSTDDGTIVSYLWDVDEEGVEPIAGDLLHYTWMAWGPYTLSLTVEDDFEQTDTYELPVDVLSRPTAVIDAPVSAYIGEEVDFSSLDSTDEDGEIISQQWYFPDDGSGSSGTLPSHTFLTIGEWEVELSVTDDNALIGSVVHKIAILPPPNQCPTAVIDLGEPPLQWLTFQDVQPSGASSTDTDGSILEYEWAWGDSTDNSTGVSPTHTYDDNGTYTVTLTVTDDDGCTYQEVEGTPDPLTISARTTVEIEILNRAPVPDLDVAPNPADPAELITFDASASYDSDGSIVSYNLVFGDDTFAASLVGPSYSIEHSYDVEDTYTAVLTIRDNDGEESEVEVEVLVGDPSGYSGTFDIPHIDYDTCGISGSFYFVSLDFDQLEIEITSEGAVTVNPAPYYRQPGEMTGEMDTATHFTAENRIDGGTGGCDEIYSVSGTFTDSDNFVDGTFAVDFIGPACSGTVECIPESWEITGGRAF